MTDSAILTPAAERRQATASRLTAVCRRLTIERGLTGYTIEEVCSEVGVSRRTFFNYFPSKEEAVFGIVENHELERFAQAFLSRGSRGWSAVVDDLAEFAVEFAENAGINAADHLEFMEVLASEPKLLARFLGMSRERDAALLELVALREGVPTSDPRARACVDIMSTVMRSTGERLHDPAVAENFAGSLYDSLAALREVLTTRKAHA